MFLKLEVSFKVWLSFSQSEEMYRNQAVGFDEKILPLNRKLFYFDDWEQFQWDQRPLAPKNKT